MKILIQIISLTLILTLNLFQTLQLHAQCHIDDWTALKALYENTDGDYWMNNTGWGQVAGTTPPAGCDLGSMYGVTIDGSGRVSQLSLHTNELSGSIPIEIENLTNLTNLDLYFNQLTGGVSYLGNLTNLEILQLHQNQFSGSIPPALGSLSNLTSLSLHSNQFSGSIPLTLSYLSNLTSLNLSYNQLSGNIPLVLGNLNNLTSLSLRSNQFSGSIPSTLGNLSNLTSLNLGYNQLSGSIPPTLGNLSNLANLYLPYNQLSGNIPLEISNLNNLIGLGLNNNALSGNIPSQLGNLTNLLNLYLGTNQLTGSIPPELANLNNLQVLSLFNNQLSGCYDPNLTNLCSQLTNGTNGYISNNNNFDAEWEDFCAMGTGTCSPGVLPGDSNADGIVNTDDALYWGLAEGFTGAVRPNATIDCTFQDCADWSKSVNDVNSKHQDGDGNGIVDNQDLQVIRDNFGCTQNYTAPNYNTSAPIYRIEPQGIVAGKYKYAVYAENGTGGGAVAHGLAFTVTSDIVPISAITMNTAGSSLNPDEEFTITDGNQCHTVLTRTNGVDVTCNAPIATFLVATSNVPVGTPFEIDITYGSKIKADATLDNITGASIFSTYNGIVPNSSNLTLNASITHEKCDALGKAIAIPSGGTGPYTYAWSTGASSEEVTNLVSGSYTVTVSDTNGLNQSLTFQINGQTPIYDANGNLICGNLCPDYLAPSGVIGTGLYSADNTLDSDAIIPTGNTAEYKAGQVIKLDKGFKVQPNAGFSAEIDDCQ